MLQKVEIIDPAETTFLIGEQVDRSEFDEVNAKTEAEGRKIAKGMPVLLGITKASLQTRSFFSAASFQRSEEHTSELQSLMRISYAVFCLQKKKYKTQFTYRRQE